MKKSKVTLATKGMLTRLRKYFPQVNQVVDAKDSIKVSVTKEDVSSGRKKDPGNCALARACTRQGADGAIINIGYSYLIKGDKATRYTTSVAVGREITSFDRHADFATGKDYMLSKISPSNMMGRPKTQKGSKPGPRNTTQPPPLAVHTKHRTTRIRVARTKD